MDVGFQEGAQHIEKKQYLIVDPENTYQYKLLLSLSQFFSSFAC